MVAFKYDTGSSHVIILLAATFVIYAYRDLWPLATFTLAPLDTPGWTTWSRIAILGFAGVLLPLVTPRTPHNAYSDNEKVDAPFFE